jgi:hypothetical protein
VSKDLMRNLANNVDNKLLDTFQHHEKSFPPQILNPTDARLGRWMLIYALLQVLSTLSVDVMGIKYPDKIRYFACPSITGLPPWKSAASNNPALANTVSENGTTALMRDATQKLSYCWMAPTKWSTPAGSAGTLTPTPPAYEMSASRGGPGHLAITALPSIGPSGDDITGLRNAFANHSLSELDGAATLRRQRSVNRNGVGSSNGQVVGTANRSPPPLLRSPVGVVASPTFVGGNSVIPPPLTTTSISAVKSRSGDLILSDSSLAKDLNGSPTMQPPTAGYSLMPSVRTPPMNTRSPIAASYHHQYVHPHDSGMPPPHIRPDVPARSPQREKVDPFLPDGQGGILVKRDVDVLREYAGRRQDGLR